MTPLFKKLNFKNHASVVVLQSPTSFEIELKEMEAYTRIFQSLEAVETITFVIAFVTKQPQIDTLIAQINEKLQGDGIVWLCYPKGTSKKYQCDFNRDTGWASVGALDFEPVRAVAIDADWSALRFRKVNFIKKITRKESFALTKEGKARTTQKDEILFE
jgi:hypothetical protein